MKNCIKLFIVLFGLTSCAETKSNVAEAERGVSYSVDDKISEEVDQKLAVNKEPSRKGKKFINYANSISANIYESDSLVAEYKNAEQKVPFRSFYYLQNDTLTIDGMYGVYGGFGFSIKLIDDQAYIYHLVAGDSNPLYASTKEGELALRLEIPCTNTSLTLSEIPKGKEDGFIYGLVEFDSDEYYEVKSMEEGKELQPRKEMRADMKIYFKANYYELGE